jgi:hypothetical protein
MPNKIMIKPPNEKYRGEYDRIFKPAVADSPDCVLNQTPERVELNDGQTKE